MIRKKELKPIYINNLVRIGKENDGGYVIPKSIFSLCDGLLSYGINKDWSFEKDFQKYNPRSVIHCYDHTLNFFSLIKFTIKSFFLSILHFLLLDKRRFLNSFNSLNVIFDYFKFFNKKTLHFKNRIWDINIGNSIRVKETLKRIESEKVKKIFIKMDIETAEYRVINSIISSNKIIVGMVIEFHELDKYSEKFNEIINSILKYFHIVHIHGNNYSKIIPQINFPSTIEITFMNKRDINFPIKACEKEYPIEGLDQPNRFSKPDYKLNFN